MGLPGITREEMTEVDRIMVQDFKIPVELMMELAGFNLAKLAQNLSKDHYSSYIIIAGTGNNAGGGIAAARRLAAWGSNVQIIFPKGINELKKIPKDQYLRAKQLGIEIIPELPYEFSATIEESFFIDAYLGYGFTQRQDDISRSVFNFLSSIKILLSLDIPSGIDATTGVNYSSINPIATLTLGFVKRGLLTTKSRNIGDLYIADIGIPIKIYWNILSKLWNQTYKKASLNKLYSAFKEKSMHKVNNIRDKDLVRGNWTIS